jgi:ABC-type multidrug transport system ATPase subunit
MNQLPAATAMIRKASVSGRPAVEIAHLRKAYGNAVAVDDVSLSVAEGEIFGILGPNGAGKTTTVECAIGLRAPDKDRLLLGRLWKTPSCGSRVGACNRKAPCHERDQRAAA